jgi:neutral ceramidase
LKQIQKNTGFVVARKIIKWLLISATALVALIFITIGPIDRTPLKQQSFYLNMMAKLDTLSHDNSGVGNLHASWTKVNITPSYTMPMAGYKVRDYFDSVHDSLFARIILLKVNNQTVALVNVDLLIFPPNLKRELTEKLSGTMPNLFLYLSATHTHNGVGGWDNSIGGSLALGEYNPQWVGETANKIASALTNQRLQPASIRFWESEANDLVENRIAHELGKKDGKLRGLIIEREDSTRACLFAFSAHPTSIRKQSHTLSADYPGRFIERLEKQFDFGMYMAGMVGSHSFTYLPEINFELVDHESELLEQRFSARKESEERDSISISTAHIPIEFGASQLRLDSTWRARSWVLGALLGKLRGELTYLRLGDIVMIGTPCDFSGEIAVRSKIDSLALSKNKKLMITSFNGNYTGYITHDGHYDSLNHDEVRIMNWVGPYYGEYYREMIKRLLARD